MTLKSNVSGVVDDGLNIDDTKLLHRVHRLAGLGYWRWHIASKQIEWSDDVYRIFKLDKTDYIPTLTDLKNRILMSEQSIRAIVERVLTNREIGSLDQKIECADGSVRDVLLFFEGRYETGGNPTDLIGTIQDISHLKQAEEERLKLEAQLRQAQKLESLGVLAGGIAHDFNNLLMGILGNADLALIDLALESPARQSIEAIEIAAKRAADLARQMLAYSGKGHFVIKRLDLKILIQEMQHLLGTSISKNAILKCEFAESVPPIEADAAQIRQVLFNLIVNASEAIGEKSGIICIRTGSMACDRAYFKETYLESDLKEGIYSYIEVSDTGDGMKRETLARIFDPFFTTKFTGRGLGLAAVLGIVRGHNAAIKVYSETKKGTTFKVLFPSKQGVVSTEDQRLPRGTTEQFKKIRVLLVDDEETVRTVGASMLKRLGCQAETAEDGRIALEMVRTDPEAFDCIILDLTMPNMDGEECFREVRRISKNIAVILSSGYNEQDLIDRFAGKPLAGFIQKPYKTALLREKLLKALIGKLPS